MAKWNPITTVLDFFAKRKAARLRKAAFQKREREFAKEVKDYYEKIRSAAFPNSITKAIDDPWVAYFLAHNPDRVDGIAQLDSIGIAKEIAKIKADIEIERAKTGKKISTAPPPTRGIKGTGDPGIRSRRPDWSFYNTLPVLSINECMMLLINVDPKETYLDSSKKKEYARVRRLVQSYQAAGELPSFDASIAPPKFKEWAESKGLSIPKEWEPTAQTIPEGWPPVDDLARQRAKISGAFDASHERTKEGLRAAKAILNRLNEEDHLPKFHDLKTILSKSNVVDEIKKTPELYQECSEYIQKRSPQRDSGIFKERYPLLHRDWPEFAEDETVLAVWEDLKSNQ